MAEVRIATFNLENFDETEPGQRPSLAERIALMRPQIIRLRADVACFQEVNGQERDGQPRQLPALGELLKGTNLEGAAMPVENTVPEPARYTSFHHGVGSMLDHMLITRNLLALFRGTEIHNAALHDESVAFGTDRKYPRV
jgi:endonuclease/exonuclease/phosphatase family metal-dependent hydrolase